MRAAAILPRRVTPATPRWVDRAPRDSRPSSRLLDTCHGNAVLASILQARGLTPDDAAALLDDTSASLADPFLFAGMDTAVACLRAAARQQQRCAVFGDFDCDGVAGTALLAEGLSTLGLPVSTLLPQRLRDGYGLAPHHVEQIAAEGSRLLVTVDCGTTSHAALARAAELGVTVIVTDHHPPRGPLPPCTALLNPHRTDNRYPHRNLCGAGVAYTVLRALAQDGAAIDPAASLDLVALATIADVVPLCGENRVLVRQGLPLIAHAARPGLRALIAVSGVSRLVLWPRDVAFGLAPRLNAAGRLGDAGPALALLRARRPREARLLAAVLDTLNTRRQELTRAATEEAVARIEGDGGPGPLIVAWDATWHPGVVGLVAARLVERYGRPAVAIGQRDGYWRGSARSIAGFDIGDALACCADLLVRQGGHVMAAGLEAADERCLEALRWRLGELAEAALGPDGRPPVLPIDLHLAAAEVDWRMAEAAEALQPCGAGWPDPIVAVQRATVLAVAADGGALRLTIAGQDGMALTALARSEIIAPAGPVPGTMLDLAVTPTVRDRRGYRCLELDVLDARPAGVHAPAQLPAAAVMV